LSQDTPPSLDERLLRSPRKVALYLFLGALAVRLLYLSQYANSPFFSVPALDGLYHDLLAQAIAAGKASTEPFFRAPLYYHFLAAIYKLFGHNYWSPRLIQAAIGSASCVLLYRLGSGVFRPGAALFAAAAMALYGPLVYFDGELHTPVLEVFLTLAFLNLAHLAWEKRCGRLWLAAGLMLGLAAITRPNVLFAVPLAGLWLLCECGVAPKQRWAAALALAAGCALFPGLVMLRNGLVGGDPVFIASQGGINLWLGNRDGADGFTPSTPRRYRFGSEYEDSVALFGQRAAEEAAGRRLKPSESQAYWVRQSLAWWREHPGRALALTGKKLVLTWSHQEIRNTQAFDYVRREVAPVLWLCPFGFWIAGPLGLLGMLLAWRGEPRARPLAVFILGYTASFLPFFAADRYRLPVVPLLLLFGAYAGFRLADLVGRREVRPVLRLAPALIVMTLFVNLDWFRTVTPATWAADYWAEGNRFQRQGRLPEAEARFVRALKLDPANAEIWINLGATRYAGGRWPDAAQAFKQAIELAPDNATGYYDLALCALQDGHAPEGKALLRQALRVEPEHRGAREELRKMEQADARAASPL
jgi:4-amino-4-deoxy-L-arabinose transferase-like glycosyltransferase